MLQLLFGVKAEFGQDAQCLYAKPKHQERSHLAGDINQKSHKAHAVAIYIYKTVISTVKKKNAWKLLYSRDTFGNTQVSKYTYFRCPTYLEHPALNCTRRGTS